MTTPAPVPIALDVGVRRSPDGRVLIGGAPIRIVTLSRAGARRLDHLLESGSSPESTGEHALVRRLLDGGLAHPRPIGGRPLDGVTVVVPVRDDAVGLGRLLGSLPAVGEVIVVDDGSTDPGVARVAAGHDARLIRNVMAAGPGAARTRGAAASGKDLIAFLDADVHGEPGWLETVLAHFDDPAVVAVAPRVLAERGDSVIDRYEAARSPLDLGEDEGRVAPGARTPYVPSAALVVRRDAFASAGGFDPALRVGEDVDLVWRMAAGGATVRYEPAARVRHRNRSSWPALARQRAAYGSAAAPLARRHPGAVAPVRVNAWSAASWALMALGGQRAKLVALALGAVSAGGLVPRLHGRVENPMAEAVRLGGGGHLWAGRWLAAAVTRAWLPIGLVAALGSRRAAGALAAALVAPALVEWFERRPDVDPARWIAARALDDAAYCVGVWRGVACERSLAALRPELAIGERFDAT